jgi:hypothetical protein
MLPILATRTDAALEAERLVRDPALFKWYAVTLLALVIYAYANEVERRRWVIVAAGAAVWLAGWFNEIVNALVLEATDRAPLWATTGPTAYQFLVGLNLEISFMFAIAGIVYAKLLPADRARASSACPTACHRARALRGQRRGRALPARLGHVPLGVLVVEHPVRAVDRRLRLPVVLPLRRLGVRRP